MGMAKDLRITDWCLRADTLVSGSCGLFEFSDFISVVEGEGKVLQNGKSVVLSSRDIGDVLGFSQGRVLEEFLYYWAKSRGWGYTDTTGFGYYIAKEIFLKEVVFRVFGSALRFDRDDLVLLVNNYNPLAFTNGTRSVKTKVYRVSYEYLAEVADEMFVPRSAAWLRMFTGILQVFEPGDFNSSYVKALEVMEGFEEAFSSAGGLLADTFFKLCFDRSVLNRVEKLFSFFECAEFLEYTYS